MNLSLLYELRSRTTKVTDFKETPDGPRADIYLEGEVKGKVSGRFQGVDYGLSRASGDSSGVIVLHVHETIETADGPISVVRRGFAIPEGGRYRIKATCTFQTGSKEFGFLNTALALAEGYADAEKVELSVFEVL